MNKIIKVVAYPACVVLVASTTSGAVLFAGKAFERTQTSLTLTSVEISENIEYDMDPGDIAAYRFGVSGRYNIRCREGAVVDFRLPDETDAPNDRLEKICQKISTLAEAEDSSQ